MSINRKQAEQIVLERLNRDPACEDRFVIIDSELAPRGDYWIIRANSAAYVESEDFSRMYVGVNAYLIDTQSGTFDTVGSAQQVEDVLQELYDLQEAGGRHYVLACGINRDDKPSVIRLHRVLDCSLTTARQLIDEPHRFWLHGQRQTLLAVAELLSKHEIAVEITLADDITGIPEFSDGIINLDEIRERICTRITNQDGGGELWSCVSSTATRPSASSASAWVRRSCRPTARTR